MSPGHWCRRKSNFARRFQIGFASGEQGGKADPGPGDAAGAMVTVPSVPSAAAQQVVSTSALLMLWGKEKQIVKEWHELQLLALN